MPDTEKFSLRSYFWILTRLLREPGRFFAELPQEIGLKHSISFLLVSSLFFTAASLWSNTYFSPVSTGIIFFVNAMGMVFIAAGFGYIVMTMTIKRSVTFARFFSVYAFSSGITLLVSWVPFFIWLTEPWKWWLIGTGMMKCCGFRLRQAALVIGVSICLMFLLFLSLLPIL
ncbi:MAG: YIP1 family protein [Thermodesulfobacteriota bacterium]|nr:YIP1 family protein [Thermodesulfobacteriota bacterium]